MLGIAQANARRICTIKPDFHRRPIQNNAACRDYAISRIGFRSLDGVVEEPGLYFQRLCLYIQQLHTESRSQSNGIVRR